jgi:hypothetical protein
MKSKTINLLLASGTVIAMILLGIAAIYAVWVADHRGNSTEPINKNRSNPLIYRKEGASAIDKSTPKIPGITVYRAEKDADCILADAKERESEFRRSITKKPSTKAMESSQKLMQKRDNFAAERLELLRKIEAAKTKEERYQLIQGLNKLSEKTGK